MAPRWVKALMAIAVGVLGGCAGDGGSQPGIKVYRHSMDGAPTNLDPAQAATIYAAFVVVNLFDTLYRYKYLARPYELTPNLALAMPEVSADGLTYTIRLKPGVRFAADEAFPGGRGREVTAADVAYSLKRHFDPAVRSHGAWLWRGKIRGLEEWQAAGANYDAPVAGLNTPDPHTLVVDLVRPFPQFTHTLALAMAAIVPREAVEHYGREFGVNPVGSGPFRLLSFDVTKAVLERNPDFRQEPVDLVVEGYAGNHPDAGLEAIAGRAPPFLDRLEFHFIADETTRWISFSKGDEIQFTLITQGQIDQILESRSPPSMRPALRQNYRMHIGLESGFVYIAMNLADPDLGPSEDPHRDARNRALRCALRKAFDWELRNQTFYSGIGEEFPGIIPPILPEFDPTLPRDSIVGDPAGARALLAQFGWNADNLPVLEYGFVQGVVQQQSYEQLRSEFTAIGYPARKVQRQAHATFGDLNRAYRNRQMHLTLLAWTLDYPDAENVLQLFYGPNASPGSNTSNYANPEYDRLYEAAAVMKPSPERTELYRRMNRMLIDDCATISGLSRRRLYLTHNNVVAVPDRDTLGGFFLRFVDLR